MVITPKLPKANSIHTPPLNIVQKAVFSLIHFPTPFICHGWGLFLEQTGYFHWRAHAQSSLSLPQSSQFCLDPSSPDVIRLNFLDPPSFISFIPLVPHSHLGFLTSGPLTQSHAPPHPFYRLTSTLLRKDGETLPLIYGICLRKY